MDDPVGGLQMVSGRAGAGGCSVWGGSGERNPQGQTVDERRRDRLRQDVTRRRTCCDPLGRDPSASLSDVDRGGRNGFTLLVEGEVYFYVGRPEIFEEGVDEDGDANHFQDLFGRHQELVRERRISVHR